VKIKTTFHGGREIEAALRQLPRLTAKAVARRELVKAGQIFANAANADAPTRGGANGLKGSYVVGGLAALTRSQKKTVKKEGRDDVQIYVGTSQPHAHLQEFGTVNHPAQPHARPAWAQTQQAMFDSIQSGFAAAVAKAVRGYAKRMAKKSKP
jgi:HK97 gp10 family phage protein